MQKIPKNIQKFLPELTNFAKFQATRLKQKINFIFLHISNKNWKLNQNNMIMFNNSFKIMKYLGKDLST